jgi:hypothetical protein
MRIDWVEWVTGCDNFLGRGLVCCSLLGELVAIVTLSVAEGSLPDCEEILRFAALAQDDSEW